MEYEANHAGDADLRADPPGDADLHTDPPGAAPPGAQPRIEPLAEDDDCYAFRQVEPPGPLPAGIAGSTAAEAPGRETADQRAARRQEEEELAWEAVARTPAAPILCSGTFEFPFQLDSWIPLLVLTVLGMLAVGMSAMAYYDATEGQTLLSPGRCALLSASAVVVGFGWLAALAIYGITIVTETAAGCAAIEDWPNVFAMESGVAVFYVATAIVLAAVPGAVVAPLAAAIGIPKTVAFVLSAVALFPPFLLSGLESHTAANVISPATWRTVPHAWRAWQLFYLLTSAIAIAVALIGWVAAKCSPVAGVVVLSFLLAAGGMIYFRLLGRLAWFCSGRWGRDDDSRQTDEEEDEEEEE
jgi:hypothetical protein